MVWHIKSDFYYDLRCNLSKIEYKSIRPLLDPLPKSFDIFDLELINIIQEYFLIPPSIIDGHYKTIMTNSINNSTLSMSLFNIVKNILEDRFNGFFIEYGIFDCESNSNTFLFEQELEWTGILIDANPVNLMSCM